MSAYTRTLTALIFATGTVTGLALAVLPPAVTVTGLALVALAVIVTTRTHLARWP